MQKYFVKIFIFTRIIFLFIIIYSSLLADNYDLSNRLIGESLEQKGFFENMLTKFMSYFYTYDTVHFTHIAKKWYTNDKNFAFFPLFPIMMNYTTVALEYISKIFSLKFTDPTVLYILSGFLLSNAFCFINLLLLEKSNYLILGFVSCWILLRRKLN
jgi:hypothetical protein